MRGHVLRHSSGVAVAMRGQVPHTRGVDAAAERAKSAGEIKASKADKKDLKPEEQKSGYKTRDVKGS
jgi:hypothetical protein